jgi:hypothetical protein
MDKTGRQEKARDRSKVCFCGNMKSPNIKKSLTFFPRGDRRLGENL